MQKFRPAGSLGILQRRQPISDRKLLTDRQRNLIPLQPLGDCVLRRWRGMHIPPLQRFETIYQSAISNKQDSQIRIRYGHNFKILPRPVASTDRAIQNAWTVICRVESKNQCRFKKGH